MKVAKARYTGPMRSQKRRGPSGTQYHFSNPPGSDGIWVPVASVEDAEKFDSLPVFDVTWTLRGRASRSFGDRLTHTKDAVADFASRRKEWLVSALNLDVSKTREKSQLEQELEPAVEEMAQHMDSNLNNDLRTR